MGGGTGGGNRRCGGKVSIHLRLQQEKLRKESVGRLEAAAEYTHRELLLKHAEEEDERRTAELAIAVEREDAQRIAGRGRVGGGAAGSSNKNRSNKMPPDLTLTKWTPSDIPDCKGSPFSISRLWPVR